MNYFGDCFALGLIRFRDDCGTGRAVAPDSLCRNKFGEGRLSRTSVLAFDIYGTLIDPYGTEAPLARYFGDQATQAADLWRAKQIEYALRRGLMRKYVDFDVCTAQARVYVSRRLRCAPHRRRPVCVVGSVSAASRFSGRSGCDRGAGRAGPHAARLLQRDRKCGPRHYWNTPQSFTGFDRSSAWME